MKTTIGLATTVLFDMKKCIATEHPESFKGKSLFHSIVHKAREQKWNELPIGELMGKIAREFVGIPYQGSTLEISPDHEVCAINLTGLDCVTFFEATLCLARMRKKGRSTPEDMLAEVKLTRYRGGKITDYSSRLHYTTDWFFDNQKKGVVQILDSLPGAETYSAKVGFMSAHPASYRQLAQHPELVEKLRAIEQTINSRSMTYVPLAALPKAEPLLKTGDIVGVCASSPPGIDIIHTGLIIRDEANLARFMDASSLKSNMKVTLEPGTLSDALTWSKSITGAMFARPLEPAHTHT